MTLLQLEQFIKDNIQQPIKAAIIIDAVQKYSSASNGAKPDVSGALPSADYARKLSEEFRKLRFDKNFHLGMGDIRLTVAMQDEIIKSVFGGNDRC